MVGAVTRWQHEAELAEASASEPYWESKAAVAVIASY